MKSPSLPLFALPATLFLAVAAFLRADPPPGGPAAAPVTLAPPAARQAAALTPTEALVRRFDTNGDGKLDEGELAAAHEELRAAPEMPDGEMDPTGQAAAGRIPGGRGAAARAIYARLLAKFDVDHTGALTPAQQAAAVAFLQQNNPYLYQNLLQRFDANGDGQLDAAETATLFATLAAVSAGQKSVAQK